SVVMPPFGKTETSTSPPTCPVISTLLDLASPLICRTPVGRSWAVTLPANISRGSSSSQRRRAQFLHELAMIAAFRREGVDSGFIVIAARENAEETRREREITFMAT